MEKKKKKKKKKEKDGRKEINKKGTVVKVELKREEKSSPYLPFLFLPLPSF